MTLDGRILDLLQRWEDRRALGQSITPEELCQESPELLVELRKRIQDLQRLPSQISTHDDNRAGRSKSGDPNSTVDEAPPDGALRGRAPSIPGYEILGELGRGGMGVVYKARQTKLKRLVALKMILTGGHAGTAARARFRTEAEAVARLQHPNIVQIHEVGEHEELPFFALEFVEGGSLAHKLAGGPLPPPQAARLVEALAQAMHLAHSRNVVHRDLKPANVLLTSDGVPKVTDFGLARQLDTESVQTHTDAVMGTPSYMAPEQAIGRTHDAGPLADVYALGAILYACLTGRPPFKAPTTLQTLEQVRTLAPTPPSRVQPRVPRDLETICMKCLAKEPHRRYASAAELADDLRRFQEGRPVVARPVGNVERGRMWVKRNPVVTVLLSAVLVSLIAGSAGIYVKYLDAKEQEGRALHNEDVAKSNEQDALTQAGIAKANEEEAIKQTGIANQRADDLREQVRQTKDRSDQSAFLLAAADLDRNDVLLARERLREIDPRNRRWEWDYLLHRSDGSLFALYGHEDQVMGVAYSPDGLRIATTGDKTVRVWDASTGEQQLVLAGHLDWTEGVAFNPSGDRIVSGSADSTARVWEAHTGKLLLILRGHRMKVGAVAFSPSGENIVTVSDDQSARVWDARSGKSLAILQGHGKQVWVAAYSPDGAQLAIGHTDGVVQIWEANGAKVIREFPAHRNAISSIAYSPDGERIATASLDSTVRIWNVQSGDRLQEWIGSTKALLCMAFSPDGARIAAGGHDNAIRLWDSHTGKLVFDLKGHSHFVRALAFNPDGEKLVTGSADWTGRVWNARLPVRCTELLPFHERAQSVAWSDNGNRVAVCDREGLLGVWDARSGRSLFTTREGGLVGFDRQGDSVFLGGNPIRVRNARTGELAAQYPEIKGAMCLVHRSEGDRLLVAETDGKVREWDAATGKRLADLFQAPVGTYRISASPDGDRIVTVGSGGIPRLWDSSGKSLGELKGHTQGVFCATFSLDGRRIVTGSVDKSARIWDADNGNPLLELKGHDGFVRNASFNSDRTRVATCSDDRTVRIWDVRTGVALLEMKGFPYEVGCVAFSPQGDRLLTTSGTQQAIWGSWQDLEQRELRGHSNTVTCSAFSPDGSRVVTGSNDGAAIIWNARTGERLADLLVHTGPVLSVAFSSNGARVVTGSADKSAAIWDTQSAKLLLTIPQKYDVEHVAFSEDAEVIRVLSQAANPSFWSTRSGAQCPQGSSAFVEPSCTSPDGTWFALPEANICRLINIHLSDKEVALREDLTRSRIERHEVEYANATNNKDSFAALFHLNFLLAFDASGRAANLATRKWQFADRTDLIARTRLHSPAIVDKVENLTSRMADLAKERPTSIHLRTLGGLLLRDGKANQALEPLMKALELRTSDRAPPVEELLLALTYHDLKQPEEAKKWLVQAETWIDKEGAPCVATSPIGTLAMENPFAVVTPRLGEPLDPRYQWPMWESWYEMDVFHAEAIRRIRLQP
jgi:WD40 repeat protein/tRNA A-37 threonylcarbamoyl transferase component Bud32